MENIIFYAPYFVCIILLFIVGANFTKINKYKSNVQFWQESFNDVSKRLQELTTKNGELKTLLGIRDEKIESLKAEIKELNVSINDHKQEIQERDETIELLKSAIEFRDENTTLTDKKLTDQAQLIQKLSDELTIKNTTIESLTNHLQDKHKQDKPFNVLESLEDLIPRKEVGKPKKEKHKGN